MADEPDDITTGHPSAHLRPADEATVPQDVTVLPSLCFPAAAELSYEVVSYGPDIADESRIRLLGNVAGKRILELGSGAGHAAIALAKQGAHVISVDRSHERLEKVRMACEREEVRVELHQSDPADVAFIRADTIDLVLSIYTLAGVEDLDRVFRQVHRVLRTECHLVFSLPHPISTMIESGINPRLLSHRYFDRTPREWASDDEHGIEIPRSTGELFTSLGRANFRVDTILEPESLAGSHSPWWTEAMAWVPGTLVIRARKEGI